MRGKGRESLALLKAIAGHHGLPFNKTEVIFFDYLTISDAAVVLIELEQLGFNEPIVDRLGRINPNGH